MDYYIVGLLVGLVACGALGDYIEDRKNKKRGYKPERNYEPILDDDIHKSNNPESLSERTN